MRTAVLFPGQGALQPRQLRALLDSRCDGAARRQAALQRWGLSPRRLRSLEREELHGVEVTHRLLAALSLAELRFLEEQGVRPWAVAGHSLGHLIALIGAGAIAEDDGVELLVRRARLMEQAHRDRPGAMLAVAGTTALGLRPVLRAGRRHGVLEIAVRNAGDRWVLSGDQRAVAEARRSLRSRGRAAVLLPMPAAFHSPLLDAAAQRFRRELDGVRWQAPRWPLISTARGELLQEPQAVREDLAGHMVRPVRWDLAVEAMLRLRVVRVFEVGPGRLLSSLVRRRDPRVRLGSLHAPRRGR